MTSVLFLLAFAEPYSLPISQSVASQVDRFASQWAQVEGLGSKGILVAGNFHYNDYQSSEMRSEFRYNSLSPDWPRGDATVKWIPNSTGEPLYFSLSIGQDKSIQYLRSISYSSGLAAPYLFAGPEPLKGITMTDMERLAGEFAKNLTLFPRWATPFMAYHPAFDDFPSRSCTMHAEWKGYRLPYGYTVRLADFADEICRVEFSGRFIHSVHEEEPLSDEQLDRLAERQLRLVCREPVKRVWLAKRLTVETDPDSGLRIGCPLYEVTYQRKNGPELKSNFTMIFLDAANGKPRESDRSYGNDNAPPFRPYAFDPLEGFVLDMDLVVFTFLNWELPGRRVKEVVDVNSPLTEIGWLRQGDILIPAFMSQDRTEFRVEFPDGSRLYRTRN